MEKASRSEQFIRSMSQREWDAENAKAQGRQGRAQELRAESPATEISLADPVAQEPSASDQDSFGSFAGPQAILARAEKLGMLRHLSAVPNDPYRPWDGPVDWSECVARDVPDFNDLTGESHMVVELGERGIDLRNQAHNVFDLGGTPIGMARARRYGIGA